MHVTSDTSGTGHFQYLEGDGRPWMGVFISCLVNTVYTDTNPRLGASVTSTAATTMKYLVSLVYLTTTVWAQLPLPSPPYIPPDASSGATPSDSSQLPNSQWSNLLGNLIYFYDAQRSGQLPSSNRVPWRNNSATDVGSDVDFDLSGGYYDAGGQHF